MQFYQQIFTLICKIQQCSPNKLDVDLSIHVGPGLPVILVKGILNGHNRVILNESLVDIEQLFRAKL